MNALVLILIILLLFGGFGFYGVHNGYWGNAHWGGGLGIVILILLVLALTGRL